MNKKNTPAKKQNQQIIAHRTEMVATSFSGPLPHPDILAKYNEVIPGLGEKIIEMTDRQQLHRFKLEEQEQEQNSEIIELNRRDSEQADKALNIDSRNSLLGLIFAFVTVALIMAAAVLCAYFKQPVPSAIIGAGGVASIVYIFIYGTKIAPQNNKK